MLDSDEYFYQPSEAFKERLEKIVVKVSNFVEDTNRYILPFESEDKFKGAGIYLLYYDGDFEPYRKARHDEPIYIGKAMPKGRRQGRTQESEGNELYSRMNEHKNSAKNACNLMREDFHVRFAILGREMTDWIVPIESALIRQHRPLWNSVIDGFGNHDPGKGRRDQRPSEWDTLHPGRPWAERLTGAPRDRDAIIEEIESHYTGPRTPPDDV